jgi:hypothetical protein
MDQQTTVIQTETPFTQQQQLREMTEIQNTLPHKQDITPAKTSNADEDANMNIHTMVGVEPGMQSNRDSQSVKKEMNVPPN